MVKRVAAPSVVAQDDQPLIGLPFEQDDRDVTCYFVDESAADAAGADDATQDALSAIGVWRDLDWNETEQALDRIRHESRPTPLITDL
ncbi:MAG: hypothetical protein QOF51_3443 [Chloroflexota bacterium]|nr:hypothetical protein [Chloroflexota bacterium]